MTASNPQALGETEYYFASFDSHNENESDLNQGTTKVSHNSNQSKKINQGKSDTYENSSFSHNDLIDFIADTWDIEAEETKIEPIIDTSLKLYAKGPDFIHSFTNPIVTEESKAQEALKLKNSSSIPQKSFKPKKVYLKKVSIPQVFGIYGSYEPSSYEYERQLIEANSTSEYLTAFTESATKSAPNKIPNNDTSKESHLVPESDNNDDDNAKLSSLKQNSGNNKVLSTEKSDETPFDAKKSTDQAKKTLPQAEASSPVEHNSKNKQGSGDLDGNIVTHSELSSGPAEKMRPPHVISTSKEEYERNLEKKTEIAAAELHINETQDKNTHPDEKTDSNELGAENKDKANDSAKSDKTNDSEIKEAKENTINTPEQVDNPVLNSASEQKSINADDSDDSGDSSEALSSLIKKAKSVNSAMPKPSLQNIKTEIMAKSKSDNTGITWTKFKSAKRDLSKQLFSKSETLRLTKTGNNSKHSLPIDLHVNKNNIENKVHKSLRTRAKSFSLRPQQKASTDGKPRFNISEFRKELMKKPPTNTASEANKDSSEELKDDSVPKEPSNIEPQGVEKQVTENQVVENQEIEICENAARTMNHKDDKSNAEKKPLDEEPQISKRKSRLFVAKDLFAKPLRSLNKVTSVSLLVSKLSISKNTTQDDMELREKTKIVKNASLQNLHAPVDTPVENRINEKKPFLYKSINKKSFADFAKSIRISSIRRSKPRDSIPNLE